MKSSNETHISLLVLGIAILVMSPNLLSEGLFTDGMYYAAISKHLSDGVGSIWSPFFSHTINNPFYEHPPLAFWLQSGTYRLLGSGFWVDKVYSLIMSCASGALLVQIASKLDFKQTWLVFLFWFSVPVVLWAIPNNMLENTVQVWVLASILAFITYKNQKNWLWLVLSV
jgi:4-amino-4-deoxy-L-arabinose transferase-like glycosyltransferase